MEKTKLKNLFRKKETSSFSQIELSLHDLKRLLDEILKGVKTIISNSERSEKIEEKIFSRAELAKLLDRDISTLWRWEKNGLLKKIKVGGRVFYRKSDLFNLQKLINRKEKNDER